MFDSNTLVPRGGDLPLGVRTPKRGPSPSGKELIINFDSVNKAMKYAKVHFYTLKNLIDSGTPYEGKIYSYSDKL